MGRWAPSPKEEPTIIPEDPSSILNHREWVTRQKQIQIAKAQLVREKLRECYIKEGVNHIQKCRKWVDMYRELIQDVGVQRANVNELHKLHYLPEKAEHDSEE